MGVPNPITLIALDLQKISITVFTHAAVLEQIMAICTSYFIAQNIFYCAIITLIVGRMQFILFYNYHKYKKTLLRILYLL